MNTRIEPMCKERGFLILDFGSQLTQLIARRLRELNYYSEIQPFDLSYEEIEKKNPYGIILSGGPNSVYEPSSPHKNITQLSSIAPLLGICYGFQLIAHDLGGIVAKSDFREYGYKTIRWLEKWGTRDLGPEQQVWMSHGDVLKVAPKGFKITAYSEGHHPAALSSDRIWAVQFHPEVAHTQKGTDVLKAFAEDLCHAPATWFPPHIVENLENEIRNKVSPTDRVICGLSGGVDSTVVATLLTKTLGPERVQCVFIDNGLLRKDEYAQVLKQYEKLGLNITGVPAEEIFLKALSGVYDPEKKRKIIGKIFIDVFEKQLDSQKPVQWLAQGTLYPDVIESTSSRGGPSHTIKSHHNVGGLPEKMMLKLLEPIRELFKDEVRQIGQVLGLSLDLLGRHPFPGPGLAVRIIGEITKEKLDILREADAIFIQLLKKRNLYHNIWQAFCVLLPIKTVGVQGDGRTYDYVLSLRAVTSQDGMTADWYPFSFDFLREVSNEITNQVAGINRVVYDITSKPPATIEWE